MPALVSALTLALIPNSFTLALLSHKNLDLEEHAAIMGFNVRVSEADKMKPKCGWVRKLSSMLKMSQLTWDDRVSL